MAEITVLFQPENTEVPAVSGETLLDIAARGGIYINSLCGGQGVCGKCRLKVIDGAVNFSSKAVGFLDKKELDEGFVLACQTEVLDQNVQVWIPPESRQQEEQIQTVDSIVRYDAPESMAPGQAGGAISYYQPLTRKHHLRLPIPSVSDNLSDMERIYRELRKHYPDTGLDVEFACLKGLSHLLRDNNWEVTATVRQKDLDCPHVQQLEAGNMAARNFGVAIDVGTTTIVTQLINLNTGDIVRVEASHNQQASYGEDVISRMIYACGRGGLDPLKNAVITTINALIHSLVVGAGITHQDLTSFVAAGNTTMTHLLLGLEPCTIRIDPYIPTASRFPEVLAADIGLQGHPAARLHCLPCVGSYVGGDITAGVLACSMTDSPALSILIDVGTNGEIVIGNNEWLVCCSASAGPAFEGSGTKCGMRATKGAVQKFSVRGEQVRYECIGGDAACGICGSGLIDLIAELMLEGIIDQSGKFAHLDHPRVQVVDDVPEFVVATAAESEHGTAVVITEDDIGNLIKSKAAIMAAMKVMTENIGLDFQHIDRLFVAGGFGAHLDIEKSIMIGLLPDMAREKIQFIGNSSLAGARISLLSGHAFRKAESIARQMTYFELSAHPGFMSEFVASMFLPHTQIELFPTVRKLLTDRNSRS